MSDILCTRLLTSGVCILTNSGIPSLVSNHEHVTCLRRKRSRHSPSVCFDLDVHLRMPTRNVCKKEDGAVCKSEDNENMNMIRINMCLYRGREIAQLVNARAW